MKKPHDLDKIEEQSEFTQFHEISQRILMDSSLVLEPATEQDINDYQNKSGEHIMEFDCHSNDSSMNFFQYEQHFRYEQQNSTKTNPTHY